MVKAFNVLSAYSLSLQEPGVRTIPIASDNQRSKEVICDLIQKMGLFPEDRGSLIMARQVEYITLIPIELFSWLGWLYERAKNNF